MATCFVIQPFDDGKVYDKRYDDVFAPAIADAGLEPYRVDHDPSVAVPISDIHRGIEDSVVCVAEISTDNPNVWYELGFAMAHGRPIVLLCSDERIGNFPFDVQHRKIIRYSTDSLSDFEEVKSKISSQIQAMLRKQERMGQLSSVTSISRVEGLEQYELAGLVIVAEEPDSQTSVYRFQSDMEKAGFRKIAATLARKTLTDRRFLQDGQDEDHDGELYTFLKVTDAGMDWLVANQGELALRNPGRRAPQTIVEPDDDLPF